MATVNETFRSQTSAILAVFVEAAVEEMCRVTHESIVASCSEISCTQEDGEMNVNLQPEKQVSIFKW